ncbi:hypothetical protein LCGC14_0738380 [marine sediment metagenome]|uniref:Uncharacterized protein n=1 Tax=marine sediment metagenome TaxID=412755 RepID=A0A0F9QSI2_9ZZZZ
MAIENDTIEQRKPEISFEFEGEDSTLFRYTRSNITPFQLVIIIETLRTVVEAEMAIWHQESIEIVQEDEVIE